MDSEDDVMNNVAKHSSLEWTVKMMSYFVVKHKWSSGQCRSCYKLLCKIQLLQLENVDGGINGAVENGCSKK